MSGATHQGEQGTPALMLPSMRDGLSALLMEVWCPFRRSSVCRHVHRELMRNALRDLLTIVPTNACWQRDYVGAYSRFMRLIQKRAGCWHLRVFEDSIPARFFVLEPVAYAFAMVLSNRSGDVVGKTA